MTSIPRLNRKLSLEGRSILPDGAGGFNETWTTLGTLWASVRARSGRERVVGERVIPSVSVQITVRSAPEGADARPRPDQRFVDGTRVYSILAVAERHDTDLYMDCWAVEGDI